MNKIDFKNTPSVPSKVAWALSNPYGDDFDDLDIENLLTRHIWVSIIKLASIKILILCFYAQNLKGTVIYKSYSLEK